MWGAIIGDIAGSIYEWDNVKTKDFGPLFKPESRFTDDTVCTIAIADILLNNKQPAETLRSWCNAHPDAGYGGQFRKWLTDDTMGAYGSWGNGSAMRISPVALFTQNREIALNLANTLSAVTHNHPEAIKGACATVDVIMMFTQCASLDEVKQSITNDYGYTLNQRIDDIRPTFAFDVSCQGTVPVALMCVLEAENFEDALRNAISLGGDSDTIACISGAMAEARFGGVPETYLREAKTRLAPEMVQVMNRLYDTADLISQRPAARHSSNKFT